MVIQPDWHSELLFLSGATLPPSMMTPSLACHQSVGVVIGLGSTSSGFTVLPNSANFFNLLMLIGLASLTPYSYAYDASLVEVIINGCLTSQSCFGARLPECTLWHDAFSACKTSCESWETSLSEQGNSFCSLHDIRGLPVLRRADK